MLGKEMRATRRVREGEKGGKGAGMVALGWLGGCVDPTAAAAAHGFTEMEEKKKTMQSDGEGGIFGHKPPHVEVGEKGTVEMEGFGERVVGAGTNCIQRCCAYADCHGVFIDLPA